MAQFDVAYFKEQGQNMIVIPLDASYGNKTNTEQSKIRNSLEICARSAGLVGSVVTVWDAGGGRMGFLAPSQWQPFFSSFTLSDVARNINKTLTCN
jgi:hypothetical protein